MYNTVIFDVDGTLIDTEVAILNSLQKMLRIHYGKQMEQSELLFAIGIPGSDSLPKLGIHDIDKGNELWNHYMKDYYDSITVFDGSLELVQALAERNITQGIVTSKTGIELRDDFEPRELSKYLTHVVCADDTKKHKPNPEPLFKFFEISGADAKKSIYIGDTIYDYQCAKDAGIDFGLALWGCRTPEKIDATYKLKSPLDILELIDK